MKKLLPISLLLSIAFLMGCSSTSPNEEDNSKARARFDEILAASPELDSIDCYDNDCTSVVYFNYNSVPEEGIELMVSMNTVTFSTWKSQNIGGSYVTIFATLNGEIILQCDGSKGALDSCS